MTLLLINSPFTGSDVANDAANMAVATHLPGMLWVLIWIGLSIIMISFGLRLYAVNKSRATTTDTVFED